MGSGDVSGGYKDAMGPLGFKPAPSWPRAGGWFGEAEAGLAWCPAAKSFREGAVCLQGLLSFANLHLTPCPQM